MNAILLSKRRKPAQYMPEPWTGYTAFLKRPCLKQRKKGRLCPGFLRMDFGCYIHEEFFGTIGLDKGRPPLRIELQWKCVFPMSAASIILLS